MGDVARVLSFVRAVRNGARVSDVKVNPDGGSNLTAEHFADAGDDAYPLSTDYATVVSVQGAGREAAVGYADPLNTPKAEPGDKRIYGRNAGNGISVNEVWLKSDGTILIDNNLGSIELKPAGEIFGLNAGGSISLKPTGELDIITAVSVKVISPSVILGSLAAIPLVLSNFLAIYNSHVHGASTTPLPQATPANETVITKGA